jgi:hypothetical protein
VVLSEFDKGRIDGAVDFWKIMAQYDQIPVPAVDDVLKLPAGTTKEYLRETGKGSR